MRFEVKSEQVSEKRGTSSRTSKPYLIREQVAYIDVGKAYPVECKINLNDLAALKPGTYEIGKECFFVQRFGEVGVDLANARLVAGTDAKPAAARVAG